ncbi:hypothetical protein RDWZM_000449 [Blomia tropicalis]|uniref:Sulfatase N-terminal domain-containing protein n=1 Tax=Blomia tropicalis TaxID=40697 RepID=A0A9Q0RPK9_BLOTA|nr:hypothetical protein RDWZM_000449 [Blomia tropicalis]
MNSKRPNILIILADDLGWGDVGFHGTDQIPTPNIDLLASTGIILNNYYISPICSPSRAALLTGYHPIHTGMQVGVIGSATPYGLPLNFPTMGDYFRELGYYTHLVGKWHQGMFKIEYFPTRRGFDTFFGYLTGHSDYYSRVGGDNWHGYDFREQEERGDIDKYAGQYSTDMYTDRVIQLIQQHQNLSDPFFIYFAPQSVHSGTFKSIQPPNEYEDKFYWIKDEKRRNFAAMVTALDDSIGMVFRALHDTGLLDDTIIFFSNDNGGSSGNNRGQYIDNSRGSNYPLKGSKYTLWEGGVRGTAFFWFSQFNRPYVSNQLIHLTDILPTLYTAVGGDQSKMNSVDGIDQWSALINEATEQVREHLLHNIDHSGNFWAVRYQNYKLTYGTWGGGKWDVWYEAPGQTDEQAPTCYNCSNVYQVLEQRMQLPSYITRISIQCNQTIPVDSNGVNQLQLFNLENDPCEMDNLIEKEPEIVDKILEIFKIYDSTYQTPVNKGTDPRANPALHDGWISPWE